MCQSLESTDKSKVISQDWPGSVYQRMWMGSKLWEEENWMWQGFSVLSWPYDLCLERAVAYHPGSRLGSPNCSGFTGEVSSECDVHVKIPVDYGAASISSLQLMWRHHLRELAISLTNSCQHLSSTRTSWARKGCWVLLFSTTRI